MTLLSRSAAGEEWLGLPCRRKMLEPTSAPAVLPCLPRTGALYELSKRGLDLLIALVLLVAGLPLWLLIALAIKLSSRGPVLFSGRVVGRGGQEFTYYKFRSMRAGDDSHHRAWLREFVLKDRAYAHAAGRAVFKVVDDSRVTRLGGLLRRLSLDEVPQLLNVLRGEMSIVGPRPPIVAEFELYDERAKARLAVPPGLTGLYQVCGRGRVPFSEMLALDLDYIRRRSLALDISVILRTVWVVLCGRGAA
jgi:lipopolysaccharide/colanic/teichoic acid biosynthesis glycosyltransferase